tara:strand:- start:245 stop:964 length:720 start_codon:yes stop_codon:yes gene_type:complete
MVVFVDDRENDLVKHKLIARMGDRKTDPKGAVEIKRLTVADYVMGDWGIEAKEINDLYHSILGHGRSRTIIGQLHDLQEAYENPVLVVYGTKLKPYIPGRARGPQVAREMAKMTAVNKKFKQNFLLHFPKIKFMQVASMDEFVDYIVNMHTQLRIKGVANNIEILDRIPSRGPSVDPRIAALSSIQGVTTRMAKDLMKKFDSIPKLLRVRTTLKSVMEIDGIGRERGHKILSLRDRFNS